MLTKIYRYPIKGFQGEELECAEIVPGKGILGDRNFSFAFEDVKFDEIIDLTKTRRTPFIKKPLLLNQMHWPSLAEIKVTYDFENQRLEFSQNEKSLSGGFYDLNFRNKVEKFVYNFLEEKVQSGIKFRLPLKKLYFLGENEETRYPDRAKFDVSIVNKNSLLDLEEKYGKKLDLRSFRGNLVVNLPAWSEENLIGSQLEIQGLKFQVMEQIGRCNNINVHPETAQENDVLPFLKNYRGKANFGVLANVMSVGKLRVS